MGKAYQILTFYDFRCFMHRLRDNFGTDIIILLFSVYLFVKGFLMTLLSLNQLPYFKFALQATEAEYQVYTLVAQTPQAMKAQTGAISDVYPLFGYHKRYYMIISALLGSVSVFLLAFLKLTNSTAKAASGLMFGAMLEISLIDLLCEGKYAQLMREKPETKGDLITWVQGCVLCGSLIASSIVGVVSDRIEAKYLRHIYQIGLPFAIQVIQPLMRGYLPEKFYAQSQRKFLAEKIHTQKKLFLLAFLMALFALVMAFINLFASHHVILAYAIIISVVLTGMGFMQMPRLLAMCNCYLFLQEALYIQIPGALDYQYTADNACVKNGPHFDMTYYLTYTQIVGAIAGFFGVVIFQTVMTKQDFRSCFQVSTGVRIIASLFDIFIISRTNLKWGIPDKVAYLFGDALIVTTASMLASMPAVLLTARICPKGYESTIYALLAGFQNFGGNVSRSIGVSMMAFFKIDLGNANNCKYDNLNQLVLVCHFAFPILTIPLTWILIPKMNIGDRVDTGMDFDAAKNHDSIDEDVMLVDIHRARSSVSIDSMSNVTTTTVTDINATSITSL